MKKVNNKKGFTLAELLVVVAILAILIAIAVPIFGGAMDKAELTAKQSNARAIKSAAMVKIMTDDIAKGAGANGGWVAKATPSDSGDLGTVTVTAETDATKDDVLPDKVSGEEYTVYIMPTNLG